MNEHRQNPLWIGRVLASVNAETFYIRQRSIKREISDEPVEKSPSREKRHSNVDHRIFTQLTNYHSE
jgi:hypothetical protein